MDNEMARIESDLEELIRRKEKVNHENAVLRRENTRLRSELDEIQRERDILSTRVGRATRKVESALTRLNILSDDI